MIVRSRPYIGTVTFRTPYGFRFTFRTPYVLNSQRMKRGLLAESEMLRLIKIPPIEEVLRTPYLHVNDDIVVNTTEKIRYECNRINSL